MTSLPVRSALGGQVMGSRATARRRRDCSGNVSPVYTMRYPKPWSTQSVAPPAPSGRVQAGLGPAFRRAFEGGERGIEHGGSDEALRGEVPLGPLDRGQGAGRQPAVVGVEGVAGRHVQDGAVDGLGAGGQVGVEPEAEGDGPLFERTGLRRHRQALAAHVVLQLEQQREGIPR